MPTAYLGLGSNRGERLRHLQSAVDGLAQHDSVTVRAVSSVYRTEAHTLPGDEQPDFLNAVVALATPHSPEDLLLLAQEVEQAEGRPPEEERRRWAPRVLDVDLLVVGTAVRDTSDLTLPHPRLADRRFVLQPLADVNPDLHVPVPFDATVQELLDRCLDDADVVRTGLALQETT